MTATKSKTENVRTERLEIRVTVAELEAIKEKAKDAGLSLSGYIMTAALAYHGQIRFSPEALEIINEIDPCEVSGHVSRCVVAVRQHEVAKQRMEEAYQRRESIFKEVSYNENQQIINMHELAGKLAGFGGGK